MERTSEKKEIPGGFVEIGTATHRGRTYQAQGARVDDEQALLYLSDEGACGKMVGALTGEVRTWGGERLGTFKVTSSWRTKVPGQMYSITLRQLHIVLDDGRVYHGRASTDACHVHAKRVVGQLRQPELDLTEPVKPQQ